MRKIYILIFALVVVVGCKINTTAVKDLTDEQKVSLLREEAKKQNIRWEIICVPKIDNEKSQHYQAEAFQSSDHSEDSRYIEDGAKGWWAETAPTPAEAAYLLSQSIQKSPNIPVVHKPAYMENGSDCAYNIILDSEHPNNIPCKK